MFEQVKETYAELGVDVEKALEVMASTPISLHCWQGDDVGGFEGSGGELGSGLAVTGNYLGKARTISELQKDLEQVLSLLPGTHRLNLHAIYGDFGGQKVDRDEIEVKHFQGWIDWCKAQGIGMDFNPSCFSHEKAADGLTLSSADEGIREFWIKHCQASRKIAAAIGEQLGSACVTNVWVPDGMKDLPADRLGFRQRLAASLDTVFGEKLNPAHNIDAVECKLFGIGSESFVVGSHEFYMGYAMKNQTALCLDAGHFHPTEGIADKISSVLMYVPELLLHVSRGVRWDSDHVVLFDDQTQAIMQELVRCDALSRTHIGLDFFDASINRIAAWVIGTRAAQKSLLLALLEPREKLRAAEQAGDFTSRLMLQEVNKALPWSVVWNEFCNRNNTPTDWQALSVIKEYELAELSVRC
ncbi:L-rhamnose isomerase [Cerasicoccus arenae]|uniref:L-rhamnose isomerase n=1 Tax=Cerasicoccus arenae TaxID=424488 RepID=A0A8J3GDW5_9BACT|nr:L-rhamnose isomerase [Cerasicoccus arenae]MBK1859499.1 L-rhamnose isomerase [Cerasicoccus arenae]GHB94996.1 L-rhamnose isomerase [Cerasicoccus arenae]